MDTWLNPKMTLTFPTILIGPLESWNWNSMTFSDRLRQSINTHVSGRVKYFKNWDKNYTGPWQGPGGVPVALVLHHTAGAATSSQNPRHRGNKKGANNGVINYVQNHFRVPAANFSIDRDGTLFVHAANPVWHAGRGKFRRLSRWRSLRVPKDQGNRWMLGVEIVSKGRSPDYTKAQIDTIVALARACRDAARWEGTGRKRLPRHKDWAPRRKIDIVYSNKQVQQWIKARPECANASPVMWDGKTPRYMAILKSQGEGIANFAAYRVACRLADLGFYKGTPRPKYEQKYPHKAVRNFQEALKIDVDEPGRYDAITHKKLFGK